MNSTTLQPTVRTSPAEAERAPAATQLNGIDLAAMAANVEAIAQDPAKGMLTFRVATSWTGGFASETRPGPLVLGGEIHPRDFRIVQDEPVALLGTDRGPNPQETLMAALNACLTVGYVANAAARGIRLHSLQIESEGQLDLRGFLGLDPAVIPGYASLSYTVRIRGDASAEALRDLHETVKRLSPNYFNLSRPVRLIGELVVE
jgi:uncharacterized OsmC-like protein